MSNFVRFVHVVSWIIFCALFCTSANAGIVSYKTLVLSGEKIQNEAGINISTVRSAVINDSGDIAFLGFLSGAGVNAENNSGLFFVDADGVFIRVRADGPAPGIDTDVSLTGDILNRMPSVVDNGVRGISFGGATPSASVSATLTYTRLDCVHNFSNQDRSQDFLVVALLNPKTAYTFCGRALVPHNY